MLCTNIAHPNINIISSLIGIMMNVSEKSTFKIMSESRKIKRLKKGLMTFRVALNVRYIINNFLAFGET